jgi:hypothetical protein
MVKQCHARLAKSNVAEGLSEEGYHFVSLSHWQQKLNLKSEFRKFSVGGFFDGARVHVRLD